MSFFVDDAASTSSKEAKDKERTAMLNIHRALGIDADSTIKDALNKAILAADATEKNSGSESDADSTDSESVKLEIKFKNKDGSLKRKIEQV
jgi:hypothetical protein